MDTDQLLRELQEIVGKENVTFAETLNPDDLHDESLHPTPRQPLAVVRPANTQEVSLIAKCASAHNVPVTPRGSGTGLSGGATPIEGGVVISFSRMNAVLNVDVDDHVVTVQPGLTLRELNEALVGTGLYYPCLLYTSTKCVAPESTVSVASSSSIVIDLCACNSGASVSNSPHTSRTGMWSRRSSSS